MPGIRWSREANYRAGAEPEVFSVYRFASPFLVTLLLLIPGNGFAQQKAIWVSSTPLTTRDGFATLRWSAEGDEPVALFRISEEHSGERQISFTDQAEIRVFRTVPGNYCFWVQACKRYPDGYPFCGRKSLPLTLIVLRPVIQPVSPPAAAGGPSVHPLAVSANSATQFTHAPWMSAIEYVTETCI